MKISG